VGYSESLGDLQLKETRVFMRDNAKPLYQRLEELLTLAKEKFTKDRSRILEEMTVDNSHDEMKLRNKVEELQRRIQELLDDNA
jgi:ubiquinone biosynthesis protein UbiJ